MYLLSLLRLKKNLRPYTILKPSFLEGFFCIEIDERGVFGLIHWKPATDIEINIRILHFIK